MHDETFHPPASEIPARHEPTDIDTRPLKMTALVAAISLLVILPALLLLFKYYERTAIHPDRDLVEPEVRKVTPTAPEPRLQGVPDFHDAVPRVDMEQYRNQSQQRLHTYGKGDDPGYVRIPIDRAMEILADRQMTTQKSQ